VWTLPPTSDACRAWNPPESRRELGTGRLSCLFMFMMVAGPPNTSRMDGILLSPPAGLFPDEESSRRRGRLCHQRTDTTHYIPPASPVQRCFHHHPFVGYTSHTPGSSLCMRLVINDKERFMDSPYDLLGAQSALDVRRVIIALPFPSYSEREGGRDKHRRPTPHHQLPRTHARA
jgi:hypothetical protein